MLITTIIIITKLGALTNLRLTYVEVTFISFMGEICHLATIANY